ncbi:hypothetical protein [Janibacter sp. GS2]|uniref:hypothetical protein n=1 Tax=Janibacter sp. GS2 TaxID=3442646 RepID=UPI003EBE2168
MSEVGEGLGLAFVDVVFDGVDDFVEEDSGAELDELVLAELCSEDSADGGAGGAPTCWVAAHPTVPAPAKSRPADAATTTVRRRRPPVS